VVGKSGSDIFPQNLWKSFACFFADSQFFHPPAPVNKVKEVKTRARVEICKYLKF
jgi:hypothetical protein